MKRLTRHGYLITKSILNPSEIDKIKKDLTMIPKGTDYMGTGNVVTFNAYKEDEKYLAIPRFYGIKHFGEPEINRLNNPEKVDFDYVGELYPNQKVHVSKTLDGLEKGGGGLIVAGCGLGKTNMALYIAAQLKVKVLFVVHTRDLCDQIRERAEQYTTCKSFGLIRGPIADVNHPIVIGTVQTIAKDKYPSSIYKGFGLVVIDEVHHMAAMTFSKAYSIIGSKYMLGISAENARKDGLFHLIKWHMGPILTYQDQPPNNKVIVKRFEYSSDDFTSLRHIDIKPGKPNIAKMETNLSKSKKRNKFIGIILKHLVDMDRNTLFLSYRVEHASSFSTLPIDSGMYVSQVPKKEREKNVTKPMILSVYQMAKEALDIPTLDTVVFAMPNSDPKQPVGRILRKRNYDGNPIVIDIVDVRSDIFNRRSKHRTRYYKQKEYQIQTFKITDIPNGEGIQYNDVEQIRKCLEEKSVFDNKVKPKKEEIEWTFE